MSTNCSRCLTHSGLKELCRVKPDRPIEYKQGCVTGASELKTKLFNFLFNLKRGQRVDIVNDEQRLWVREFVQLHGFEESVSISEDENTVYKYKFLNKDYECK